MKTARLVFRLIEVAAKACRKQLEKEIEEPVTTFTVIALRPRNSYFHRGGVVPPSRPYLVGD